MPRVCAMSSPYRAHEESPCRRHCSATIRCLSGRDRTVDDFIPKILGSDDDEHVYVTLAVRVKRCATCCRPMIPAADRMPLYSAGYPYMTPAEQAKRAGWPDITLYAVNVDGRHICDACAAEGHATFRCAMCQEERESTAIQARFGMRAEYLCKPCYTTVPAAQWDAKSNELAFKHRHD